MGVFLFNETIDDLEDGCADLDGEKRGEKSRVSSDSDSSTRDDQSGGQLCLTQDHSFESDADPVLNFFMETVGDVGRSPP